MLTKEEIIGKVEQHREKIKSFGVTKLTLIGSYARGEATAESDVDFLVEFAFGRGRYDDYVHLQMFLRTLLRHEVDLVKPALIRAELRESMLGGMQVEAQL